MTIFVKTTAILTENNISLMSASLRKSKIWSKHTDITSFCIYTTKRAHWSPSPHWCNSSKVALTQEEWQTCWVRCTSTAVADGASRYVLFHLDFHSRTWDSNKHLASSLYTLLHWTQYSYYENLMVKKKEWFYYTFHLSGKIECCRLCPVWRTEIWRVIIMLLCKSRAEPHICSCHHVLCMWQATYQHLIFWEGSHRVLMKLRNLFWTAASHIIYSDDIISTSCC